MARRSPFCRKAEEQIRPRDREHEIMTRSGRCGLASTGRSARRTEPWPSRYAPADGRRCAVRRATAGPGPDAAFPGRRPGRGGRRPGYRQERTIRHRPHARRLPALRGRRPSTDPLGGPGYIGTISTSTRSALSTAPSAPPAPAPPAPFAPSAPSAPSVWVFVFDTTHLTPGSARSARATPSSSSLRTGFTTVTLAESSLTAGWRTTG